MSTDTLEITNVGPIETLDISVPKEGGVVVLRGRNGVGKSLALDATKRLLGGTEKPQARDGVEKGVARGWGAKINIANRITRSGMLQASSLEGSFDLATLVDPGVDDPAAADAKRIKALLRLLGIEASESLFYDLVGGEDAFLSLGIEAGDDLVELAGKVKRKLESRARELATTAAKMTGQAEAYAKDNQSYGPKVERDGRKLGDLLEDAVGDHAAIKRQRQVALDAAEQKKVAQEKLAKMPKVDVEAAKKELEVRGDDLKERRRRLDEARDSYDQAVVRHELAETALGSAQDRSAERAEFEALVFGDMATVPSTEEVATENEKVESAREAVELGVLARAADELGKRASEAKAIAQEARREEETLRETAKGTDGILSTAVAQLGVDLKVVGARLCVETERGTTPVGELSHGERWKLAIDLGVKRVGSHGVLAIPQEAWEGLDPTNRELVHNHARKREVVILTAEAADGELRAESV